MPIHEASPAAGTVQYFLAPSNAAFPALPAYSLNSISSPLFSSAGSAELKRGDDMEFKEYAGRAGKAALDGAKKYWTVPAAGLASWIGIGVADHLTNGNYAFYTSMVPA